MKNQNRISRIIAIVLCLSSLLICAGCSPTAKLQSEAKKCIRDLKSFEPVHEINDAVCITKMYYNHEDVTYGYLIRYNESVFAYYEDGVYKGDGYNGGHSSGADAALNNLNATVAQEQYKVFAQGDSYSEAYDDLNKEDLFLNVITAEDAAKNVEGIIPLSL